MNRVLCIGKTDPGLVRSNNEDRVAVDGEGRWCLVTDGIGGAADGEVASALFEDSVRDTLADFTADSRQEAMAADLVERAFKKANTAILNYSLQSPARAGMGCTAEFILFFQTGFILGHVGDSRTFRLRDRELRQLTRDHSLAQEQFDLGLISHEELASHTYTHFITRAVGIDKEVTVDILRGGIRDADLFLLCSDGLTDSIPAETIQRILMEEIPEDTMADRLIHAALEAGGRDNISVALARIID